METIKIEMQTSKINWNQKPRSYPYLLNYLVLLLVLTSVMLISCHDDDPVSIEPWEKEVGQLKAAVADFRDFDQAVAAGYDIDVTGYRTQMGYHFLNASLLDDQFEIEKPEVLLYAHDGAGELELVAVEYGIPIADINNPPPTPQGFTGEADVWEVNTEFNLWTLHVWIEMENPNGIFTAQNPMLP